MKPAEELKAAVERARAVQQGAREAAARAKAEREEEEAKEREQGQT